LQWVPLQGSSDRSLCVTRCEPIEVSSIPKEVGSTMEDEEIHLHVRRRLRGELIDSLSSDNLETIVLPCLLTAHLSVCLEDQDGDVWIVHPRYRLIERNVSDGFGLWAIISVVEQFIILKLKPDMVNCMNDNHRVTISISTPYWSLLVSVRIPIWLLVSYSKTDYFRIPSISCPSPFLDSSYSYYRRSRDIWGDVLRWDRIRRCGRSLQRAWQPRNKATTSSGVRNISKTVIGGIMQQELVLAVLPFRLSIIHVPHKSSMPLLAHTLLKIFLYPPKWDHDHISNTVRQRETAIVALSYIQTTLT
jgi:hypothetical protein